MTTLVTGAAGFIGFHLCQRLLARGDEVLGIDDLNDYYDPTLKQARLDQLVGRDGFDFVKVDVADRDAIAKLFKERRPTRVVHLAAQAGVRYSLTHPEKYIDANLVGFGNMLEGVRHAEAEHFVYASSSSVYGSNVVMPFSVQHSVDHPVSLYAATKKANELMAHSYSHLYGLPTTGLRFFTVYGPWGRPDMALFLFTRAILAGEPIKVFNGGDMQRDFTYIDDIIDGVVGVLDRAPAANPEWDAAHGDPSASAAPFRVLNIGSHRPEKLLRMIEVLEESLGQKAEKDLLPMQPGDVKATYADVSALEALVGFRPKVSIAEGIPRFVDWYREYYGV